MRNLRNRLATAIVSVAALAAAGLSACSSGAANNASQASTTESCPAGQGAQGSSHGPATISIAYSSTQEFNTDAEAANWFTMLKDSFQKAHPGVTVKLVPIGGSEANFFEKISLMLRDPATAPDVIHEATINVGPQVEARQLAPLQGYLDKWSQWSQFAPAVRLGGVPGPQIWQMVSGMVDFGLYYNVNQFRKAGLPVPWQPHSWAQILSAARAIKQKVPGTVPLFLYAGNQIYDQTTRENFLPLLQGTGVPATDGLRWVVGGKGISSVFGLYDTVFSSGLGPSQSMLASPTADGELSGTLMPHQQVAIALVGSWVGSWWVPGGPSPWPAGSKTYQVALLPTENGQAPGYATQAQGSTFVLTCASKHRQLAAELMEMAEDQHFNLLHVLWTGEVPPRSDVLHDPAYLNSVPYYNSAEASWTKYATFTPSYNYSAYSTCIGQATGLVSSSHLAASQAAQELDRCMTRELGASAVSTSG